ncbi:MAG: disulfide bond formation protein DsbD, partial [Cytophagales bacterium]
KAQVKEPTKWTISIAEKQVKIGDEVELIFTANIEQDWYIYTAVEKDDGPIPTKINLQKNATFQLIGNVILPTNAVEKYDDIFEMKLSTAKKQAIYKQKIKILAEKPDIKANITFQTCSLTSGLCINGNKNLSIDIAVISSDKKKNDDKKDTLKEEKKTDDNNKDTIKEKIDTKDATKSTIKQTDNSSKKKEKKSETTDWLSFIFTSFLGGFAAFLMPCIFPLLPSTVTYFVKLPRKKEKEDMSEAEKNALRRHYHREGIKKALFYGFSIVAIFTIVGTAVAAINGPAFANWLSTHWLPNVFFFLLFLVFGLSFLGLFELALPNSWVMGADKQADKGGYYGIFFMAMTLVLVSFSCTGPIVGSLLIQAAGGQVLKPIVGMMSFSTALALPFVLFAIFPTWLSNMPKSGGWFGVLKVSLGFLELAI